MRAIFWVLLLLTCGVTTVNRHTQPLPSFYGLRSRMGTAKKTARICTSSDAICFDVYGDDINLYRRLKGALDSGELTIKILYNQVSDDGVNLSAAR